MPSPKEEVYSTAVLPVSRCGDKREVVELYIPVEHKLREIIG